MMYAAVNKTANIANTISKRLPKKYGDKVDMTHAVTTTEAVRVIVTSGPDPYHDAPGRVAKSTKGTNETRKQ